MQISSLGDENSHLTFLCLQGQQLRVPFRSFLRLDSGSSPKDLEFMIT
jgi:hypothetical protein